MEYKWIYRPLLKRPRTLPLRVSFSARKSVQRLWRRLHSIPTAVRSWRGLEDFGKFAWRARAWGSEAGRVSSIIWRNDKFPVFLITVFPKNEKENLSKSERNALKKRADDIFRIYSKR
jgi:hypothetical protein